MLITGLKHSGKTSTGRLLAGKFGTSLIDTDDLLEEIYRVETGYNLSSRDIYRKGRDLFQNFEASAAEKAALAAKEDNIVCSAGGGICENGRALEFLTETFTVVYISEIVEILYKRIIKNGIPAFLSEENPFEDFNLIYKTRDTKYDKICDIKIEAAGRSISEICLKIIEKLTEEGYAG